MSLTDFIKLLRPNQWYKNLLVFLAIFFSGNFLNLESLYLVFLGFISLIAISSANYIINDIVDIRKDRSHPEKSLRPLASGKVKIWQAVIIGIALIAVSLFIASNLHPYFLYSVLFLFGFTQLYSFFLKKEAFADVIAISINFIVRASAGAFIINVLISPWLILVVFFLALFLTLGKRKSDLVYLGENASEHKPSLKNYSKEIIDFLMIISTSALVITYSLYCTLGKNPLMLFTLPIAIYALFRYISLVYSGSEIGRQPHKVFKDLRMVIAIILWIAVSAAVLYSSVTLSHLLP